MIEKDLQKVDVPHEIVESSGELSNSAPASAVPSDSVGSEGCASDAVVGEAVADDAVAGDLVAGDLVALDASPRDSVVEPVVEPGAEAFDGPVPVALGFNAEEYLSPIYKSDLAGLRSTRIRYWYSMGLVTIPLATIVLMIFLTFVVGAHLIPKFCNY